MKSRIILAVTSVMAMVSLSIAQPSLSKEDRKMAAEQLQGTMNDLLKSIKGLSEEQLNFKPTPETWSVAECVEHITITESALWQAVQGSLDSDSKMENAMTDEQILGLITDRSNKVQTRPEFVPSGKFGSHQATVDEFKKMRKSHIKYVKTTDDDLRGHFYEFPFGPADSYQVILFMAGHTTRHTMQLKEVMNHADFPGSK